MDPTNSVSALAAALIAAVSATNAPVVVTRPPPVPPAAMFAVGASRAVGATAFPQLTTIRLDIPYPPEKLSTDVILRIYSTTNVVTPDWKLITNLMNMRTSCLVQLYPDSHYFRNTSYSIFWQQETAGSPVTQTLPGPVGDLPTIISRP